MPDQHHLLEQLPLIAILRGVTPNQVFYIAEALIKAGIRVLEVPLNSPNALTSIEMLANEFSERLLLGAGTVTSTQQVQAVYDAGGKIIVSPNCDPQVISASLNKNLICIPGVATATDAFAAIAAGATRLKLFPAQTYGPNHLSALKSVLPAHIKMYPVGGVDESNLRQWLKAGADGFGFGSSLYQLGNTALQVQKRASSLCHLWEELHPHAA
jgi:2-dehydro-3-deoxyphosphogalactonate aldolase